MNMRAGLVDAGPSTRSGASRSTRQLVYIPAAELFELLPKIGEETDGQVARPVGRKPRRRQAGIDVRDDPPGVDASDPSRKRFPGSEVGSRHRPVRGQEILMPSSNGGQVPPFPDGALEATRDPRLIGQEDGGRVAYAEIGKDLLHLCCEIFRTNPERGRDSAAADPRQPTAELMPQLPLALRDRVRNQAPTIRRCSSGALCRCAGRPAPGPQWRLAPARNRHCHHAPRDQAGPCYAPEVRLSGSASG